MEARLASTRFKDVRAKVITSAFITWWVVLVGVRWRRSKITGGIPAHGGWWGCMGACGEAPWRSSRCRRWRRGAWRSNVVPHIYLRYWWHPRQCRRCSRCRVQTTCSSASSHHWLWWWLIGIRSGDSTTVRKWWILWLLCHFEIFSRVTIMWSWLASARHWSDWHWWRSNFFYIVAWKQSLLSVAVSIKQFSLPPALVNLFNNCYDIASAQIELIRVFTAEVIYGFNLFFAWWSCRTWWESRLFLSFPMVKKGCTYALIWAWEVGVHILIATHKNLLNVQSNYN